VPSVSLESALRIGLEWAASKCGRLRGHLELLTQRNQNETLDHIISIVVDAVDRSTLSEIGSRVRPRIWQGFAVEQRMPLARYFLYVGGVLLTLLFILDAYLTKIPFADRADPNLPVIRIHSDRKWPDRVVFDTSLPTVPPMRTTIVEDRVPSPPARAYVAVKEERSAFALMQLSDAGRLQPSDPGKRAVKQQRQRRIAKKHVMPRSILVARQPHSGWFGNTIW
jgi:hypothetical protein